MRRRASWATVAAVLALWTALPAAAQTRAPHLTFLAPADSIDPDIFDTFARETGIKVIHETYPPGEGAERLLAAKGTVDLVLLPAHQADRLNKAGALAKLDAAAIPNLSGIAPAIAQKLAGIDPRLQAMAPFAWSPLGLAYNSSQVRARLGGAPVDSWAVLFRPADARRLADCGIQIVDAPEEVLAAALASQRIAADSRRSPDMTRAIASVSQIRAQVRRIHPYDHIAALASGDTCLALASAADAIAARNRAAETENEIEIGFAVPREGGPMLLEVLAVAKDAARAPAAQSLINFLLRPAHAAKNALFTGMAPAVAAARSQSDAESAADSLLYPDAAVIQRLVAVPALDEATQRSVMREWGRLKAAR